MKDNFKVEIGTIFKNDKRNLLITGQFRKTKIAYKNGKTYKNNQHWYKYTCLKCGWKEGEIYENNLINGMGCACCHSLIVVEGINDIPTTAPWMVDYFQGGYDEAKLYTKGSTKKIYPQCPICHKSINKLKTINDIYQYHTIGCSCEKGVSFPEKFIMNFLDQCNIKYIYQLTKATFKWCDKYRYDFYLPDYNAIIEVHGLQHYEKGTKNSKFLFEKTRENDRIKQDMASDNGIEVYCILDCRFSNVEYIKNSIFNNEILLKICNVDGVDWNKCEEFAYDSLFRKACELKKENHEYTTGDIGKILKLDQLTINRYLKRGNKLGLCKYSPKEEISRRSKKNGFNGAYEINVIDKDTDKILGTYHSARILHESSLKDFGIIFYEEMLRQAAKYNKIYKGYKIKYTKDLNKEVS